MNSNHALAGLWVQALSFADQGDMAALDQMTPDIVRWDRQIANKGQFDNELRQVHNDLVDIRIDYHLPRICKG